MMKLFSSTVCPLIDKDVCVFAYGGVDGRASILRSFRTVIVNIK